MSEDAPAGPACSAFVDRLHAVAPSLSAAILSLANEWLTPLLGRLNDQNERLSSSPKIFNDPVWGSILLQPAETLLLDTPLLQHMRGVRQLGMAHYVYPGAGYGRLEHICGVVEGTQRIITSLDASVSMPALNPPVPRRKMTDLEALRLAALLHDVGHGPFSHATEDLIEGRFKSEFDALKTVIFEEFDDVLRLSAAEVLSVLITLSEPMLRVLTHSRFPVSEREHLPLIIVGAIIGSAKQMSAPYLAAIVSGPIDADKLDYMVRDSHHAGLNIGLETTRLLSQLQVAVLTEQNAPNAELRSRARAGAPIYEMGISRAGIGAYEQMIVGRAILYDRVYYHHKVRATEAMVRRLIQMAEIDNGGDFTLFQLIPTLSDDTFIYCLGGLVKKEGYPAVSQKTKTLAQAIINRDLFKRAFAFATRFLEGIDVGDEQSTEDSISLIGRDFYKIAADNSVGRQLEKTIADRAAQIANVLGGKYSAGRLITPDDIIVDLPSPDKIAIRGQDILVRTGAGDIELPNLYFDPQKWSRAYQVKKLCGFVFCPNNLVPVVNIASKIVFSEIYQAVMSEGADRLAKTTKLHDASVVDRLLDAGLLTIDTADRLRTKQLHFLIIAPDDIRLPQNWTEGSPIRENLAKKFRITRPRGFTKKEVTMVSALIEVLASFYDMAYLGGVLKDVRIGEEKRLQSALLNHMRSSGRTADEGAKLGGGISDIVFERYLVIENKIHPSATDAPLSVSEDSPWQARRYSIPLSAEIVATVVGYKPITELGHMLGRESIDVKKLSDGKTIAIRLAVPVDYTSPSAARAP
jgi:HD superfamily phosphohydrolase